MHDLYHFFYGVSVYANTIMVS